MSAPAPVKKRFSPAALGGAVKAYSGAARPLGLTAPLLFSAACPQRGGLNLPIYFWNTVPQGRTENRAGT